MISRRTAIGALAFGLAATQPLFAQDYPSKTIRVVAPVAAGGGLDLIARLFSEFLEAKLGNTVIVENRPGAQALIGAKFVASSAPDGYTLLVSSSLAGYSVLNRNSGIDVANDLEFISFIMRMPMVVAVHASRPYRSIADLTAASRGDTSKLNYASYGIPLWMQTEILNRTAGIKATNVPFNNPPLAASTVASGDADYMISSPINIRPFVEAGKVRQILVLSRDRHAAYPGVPSLSDAGLDMDDLAGSVGLHAPKGTPKPVLDKLNATVRSFVADAVFGERLRKMGYIPFATSAEQFKDLFLREDKQMREIGAALKIGGH